MNNYKEIQTVNFPEADNLKVNMMPIIVGDRESVPYPQYNPLIEACNLEPGTIAYLTINEGYIEKGLSQRRAGLHTEAVNFGAHGGGRVPVVIGPHGGGGSHGGGSIKKSPARHGGGSHGGGGLHGGSGPYKGLYIASTVDKTTRIFDCSVEPTHFHGAMEEYPDAPSEELKANTLYWLHDKVPHEVLPMKEAQYRQFFRLISEDLHGWYAKHNTPNPYGVQPSAPILYGSKF